MTTKTITTDRPITLHGSCHVPNSFCDGIELCSIPHQKNLVPVSVACIAGLTNAVVGKFTGR